MSNCEGHVNHLTSSAAQTTAAAKENMTTSLPDERPILLAIRPAPGHPLASLLVYEQERARHPEPSAVEAETVATWANLEELAHEWVPLPVLLPSSPVLPVPTSSRRLAWPFWRFLTRRAPMRTTLARQPPALPALHDCRRVGTDRRGFARSLRQLDRSGDVGRATCQ
jgi:hypothetical protein